MVSVGVGSYRVSTQIPQRSCSAALTAIRSRPRSRHFCAIRIDPTAIFSSNARCSIGIVPVLQTLNRTDIALVGFGDFPLAASVRPAISIIEQDPSRLGRTAAARLFKRISDPDRRLRRKLTLPVNLVLRGSGEQPPAPRSPKPVGRQDVA